MNETMKKVEVLLDQAVKSFRETGDPVDSGMETGFQKVLEILTEAVAKVEALASDTDAKDGYLRGQALAAKEALEILTEG